MFMKEYKKSLYLWKIVWIIGLILLAYLSLIVENIFKEIAEETFNPIPLIWSDSIIPFIFGIYLSFIFIKEWSLNVNITLLSVVFIPSLLISFCYPIIIMFGHWGISISLIPYWIIRISILDVFGIIAGLTLMLSIFENQLKRSDNE